MKVLPKRFARYKLTLHPDKTRMVDLNSLRGESGRSFDFLGFTHFLSKSRKGVKVLKRKTSSKRLTRATKALQSFIKHNLHMKLNALIKAINVKLRGHYLYYGITFNSKGISWFYFHAKRCLFKWLRRRGGKSKWTWDYFVLLTEQWLPLVKPFISNSYATSLRN